MLPNKKPKNDYTFFLKLLLSLSILLFIFAQINLQQTIDILKQIQFDVIILWLPLILTINTFLLIYRWHVLLKKLDVQASFRELTAIMYISIFFGQILPSRFGKDVLKGYYLRDREIGSVTLSLLFDRAIGVVAGIFLNLISIVLGFSLLPKWIIAVTLGIDAVLIVAIIAICTNRFTWIRRIIPSEVWRRRLDKAHQKAQFIWKDSSLVLTNIVISFLSITTLVLYSFYIASALQFEIPLIYFFIFMPIILTITILPISLNGLGVTEYLIIVMFTLSGLSMEEALSLGIVSRIGLVLYSLIGAAIYLFSGMRDIKRNK